MKPEELINLAKAETAIFERPARSTSCLMVEMIQVMDNRIADLEKEKAIGVYHFTVEEYKAHNLEQQAKGAMMAANLRLQDDETWSYASQHIETLADDLLLRSEALKEKGE